MLTELVVEGLGVIDRAELELEAGCSVLTGETGAGKTLLVAALGLLLGGRSDRTMVREGEEEARVEGRFVVPAEHDAAVALSALGLVEEPPDPMAGTEIVLTRAVSADGRSTKARINGRLVTAGVLAEAARSLIEIAGQHQAKGVSAPALQRHLLDAFCGDEALGLAAEVARAVREAKRSERALEELVAGERSRARELDVLRYEIAEIETAAPSVGESAALTAEALELENAESNAAAISAALEALSGDRGAAELLSEAGSALAGAGSPDAALKGLSERLGVTAIEVADVASELSRVVTEPDRDALEAVRRRLEVVARVKRKYGHDEEAVLDYVAAARRRVEELADATTDLERLQRARDEEFERAAELAGRLSDLRAAGAPRLAHEMEGLLADLALGGARFAVSLASRSLYEGGRDLVELAVSTNPGQPPLPLAKVASGGELSRIALALHLLTSAGAGVMVFDEVDAGVGGRPAQAVGRALAQLARDSGAQVLVVTHLPQVAAFADAHYRVAKEQSGHRSNVAIARVDGDERVEELSRMLAGMPESARAKEHAGELLHIARATMVGAR
jgi:DNA repair protein RecN (Recombination protein N)